MSYEIRKAVQDDVPEILEELKEFSKFFDSNISLMGDNDEFNFEVISKLVSNHLFFVAVDRIGDVIGFISGFVLPHIYNPEIKVLTESFWWVTEEHRNTKAGVMLLNKFIEYGKENVDWILTTLEANSPVNENVFLKRGFKLKEKSYIMEVN